MTDQIATVSKERLLEKKGKASTADMDAVARAIRVQLALDRDVVGPRQGAGRRLAS